MLTERYVSLFITYVMLVLAGVFLWQAALCWLRNKREERIHQTELADIRKYDANEKEREAWVSCIAKKDEIICGLNEELLKLTRECKCAKETLSRFNIAGEQINDSVL